MPWHIHSIRLINKQIFSGKTLSHTAITALTFFHEYNYLPLPITWSLLRKEGRVGCWMEGVGGRVVNSIPSVYNYTYYSSTCLGRPPS